MASPQTDSEELAMYKEFHAAFIADERAVVEWCRDETHVLTKMRLRAAMYRIDPRYTSMKKDYDSWDEEKAARLEGLLKESEEFWANAPTGEEEDVVGDNIQETDAS